MNKGDVMIPALSWLSEGGGFTSGHRIQEVVALPLDTLVQEVVALSPDSSRSFPIPAIPLHYYGSESKSPCSCSAEGSVLYLKFKAAQHFLEDRVSISSQLVLSTSKESFEPGQGLAGMSTVLAESCAAALRILLAQPQHICMQTDVSWPALFLSYEAFFFFFLHSFPSRKQSVSFSL